MNFSKTRYLSTFNTPPAPAGEPAPAAPPAAPPPAPPAQHTVVQPIVLDMGQLQANRQAAQQQLAQVQAAPPPTPPPAEPAGDAGLVAEVRSLRKQIAEQNRLIVASQLSEYRVRAIAAARAQGHGLIEPLVGGSSFAEIDASIGHSIAEYNVMRADILLQQQGAPQATAAAPVVPAIPTPPVYQPQVPTGYVGQAAPAAAQAVSAPQVISAPAVPQAPTGPGGMTSEQLAYLTSSEGIRSGAYAANRAAVHAALRGGAPQGMAHGGQPWSFQQGTPALAPPLGMPIAPRVPAMQQQNVYSGVTQPRAMPAGVLPTGPIGPGYPTALGFQQQAQQPNQLQFADGSPNGVPVNPAAAREAAMAAVAALR